MRALGLRGEGCSSEVIFQCAVFFLPDQELSHDKESLPFSAVSPLSPAPMEDLCHCGLLEAISSTCLLPGVVPLSPKQMCLQTLLP